MNLDQVLLVDKPAGITSFGVVARIRRKMTEQARASGWTGKRLKVGHCGTLDPFATGLMIILTGKETKNAEKYSKMDKVYEATIILGQTSTTGDSEGIITRSDPRDSSPSFFQTGAGPIQVGPDMVEQVLQSFIGEVTQTPPIYSAIKINGQRAYELARAGKIPKLEPRRVKIYNIELISYSYPELKIRTHVSSGTYIRTLTEDIGKKLGTGAYTLELRRTKIGDFGIDSAISLDHLLCSE